jgi:hypothetical protein
MLLDGTRGDGNIANIVVGLQHFQGDLVLVRHLILDDVNQPYKISICQFIHFEVPDL